jgi:transposase
MTVKTDRKDAYGLAQLRRMGWFQQVHAKSIGSQEIRALLVALKQLLGRLLDVELSIRGILRGFGLTVGQVTRKTFEGRIRELEAAARYSSDRTHCSTKDAGESAANKERRKPPKN